MVHTLYQYEVEWVPSDTVKTNVHKILATPFITNIRLTFANVWRDLNCILVISSRFLFTNMMKNIESE